LTNNERNFGDVDYEATTQHEECTKVEDGRKEELHVLKEQLRKNMKLHRLSNEL